MTTPTAQQKALAIHQARVNKSLEDAQLLSNCLYQWKNGEGHVDRYHCSKRSPGRLEIHVGDLLPRERSRLVAECKLGDYEVIWNKNNDSFFTCSVENLLDGEQ